MAEPQVKIIRIILNQIGVPFAQVLNGLIFPEDEYYVDHKRIFPSNVFEVISVLQVVYRVVGKIWYSFLRLWDFLVTLLLVDYELVDVIGELADLLTEVV